MLEDNFSYYIISGLITIIIGALIMFFNMPTGKDIDKRSKMKQWVRIGMFILSLGVVIQILLLLLKSGLINS
jgi:hypothetical protein